MPRKEVTLVDALRQVLREQDQSLKHLGTLCGVHDSQLSRFLRGERDLTLTTASKLAAALGLGLSRLSSRPLC